MTNLKILSNDDRIQTLSNADKSIVKSAAAFTRIVNTPASEREEKLRDSIGRVQAICGIKDEVSDQTVNLMLDFLVLKYPSTTFEEIVSAAVCNLAGDYEKRIEHYGVCDIPYITSLLNAYQIRKSKAFKILTDIRNDQAPKERVTMSPQECYEGLIKFFKQNKSFPEFWKWDATFEYMWSGKLFNASEKNMKRWYQKEYQKIYDELMKELETAFSGLERAAINLKLNPEAIRSECRKRFVQLEIQG